MTITSIPALIALAVKALLLVYVLRSPLDGRNIRLLLLLTLAAHNICEMLVLSLYPHYGVSPGVLLAGYGYMVTLAVTAATMLHVALTLSGTNSMPKSTWLGIYLPTAIVVVLLVFTDHLVKGFVPMNAVTIIRDPGPLYPVFEGYLVVDLVLALAVPLYAAKFGDRPMAKRIRLRWWVIALAPMASLIIYLIVARHFGFTRISSTIYVPIAQTWFLVFSIYATHGYRLEPATSLLPWSRSRRRKTMLYKNMEHALAEIRGRLGPQQIVDRLASIFECRVALVTSGSYVTSPPDDATLVSVPRGALKQVNRTSTVEEIGAHHAGTARVLRECGVEVVAPFLVRSRSAQGWLLVGSNQTVYSRTDFMRLERLAAQLAEILVDRILVQRRELIEAYREIRRLRFEIRRITKTSATEMDTFRRIVPAGAALKSLAQHIAEYEAHIIRVALDHCGQNKAEAARVLGTRANTLHYKLLKYGIT